MYSINVTLLRFCYGCDACRWSRNETKRETLTDSLCVQKCAESFRKRYLCFVISSLFNNTREVLRFLFCLSLKSFVYSKNNVQCSPNVPKKGSLSYNLCSKMLSMSRAPLQISCWLVKKTICSVRLASLSPISGRNNEFWMTFTTRGQSFLKIVYVFLCTA